MKRIIENFIKYGIYSNIIIAVTIILGTVTLLNTKKSFFPERKARNITIQVVYPGASPEEVEQGITQKIEDAIENISGIDEFTSTSSENISNINIEILTQHDIDEILTEIKNTVDGISGFPAGAERPTIFKLKPRSLCQWLGLSGDVDLRTLKEYSDRIKDDLLDLSEVSQVSTFGFPSTEISIEVSEDALLRYGFTFDQVTAAIRTNNFDLSAGSLKTKNEEVLIRSRVKRTEVDKIGEIVLRANSDGTKILLRDVVTIKEQFVDQPSGSTLNGKPSIFLLVEKLTNEDIAKISKQVNQYVEDFNEKNNILQLTNTYDFYVLLSERLKMLLENFGWGMILVIISLGLFLSIRLSLWVAWGIPASFLGMFILASFIPAFTINMISLFGMILVVGILVDDGIVIAENIYQHFERGKNAYRAAVDGTIEVFPAVSASVTTTMIAFTPVLLAGEIFEFIIEMAIVVIFSLGFSLCEAFLVLPAHLGTPHVLRSKNRNSKIRNYLNNGIAYLRDNIYGNVLKYTIKYKWISLCTVLSLFPIIIGLMGGGYIKATFFPKIEFSSLSIDVAFKPGTPDDRVKVVLSQFDSLIWDLNEELKIEFNDSVGIIKNTFGNLGGNNSGDQGGHAGSVSVFYRELDDESISSFELKKRLKDKIGDIPEAEKLIVGGSSRFGKPIVVRLSSKNKDELEKAKDFVKIELRKIEELHEIKDNINIGKRELQIDLNEQAYFLGFSHNDIARQIRQGFFGEEVQRIQKSSDEVRIWVRYPNSDKRSFGQLENLKVKGNQKEYQLNELVDYKISRGVSSIKHYNAARTVTVDAEMVDPDAPVPPVLKKVEENIIPILKSRFEGVKVEMGGQAQASNETVANMQLYFGGALFVIFIIIMITFKSFYQAVLIIIMIPLGWIGSIIGHGIEDLPVSFLSAWGMVALSGVIINDAVVFLDKYNRTLLEGKTVKEAAFEAGINRFRPILLTSLTTVLGLLPLIKETSFQAQFLIPMGVSIAYGVLIGTFIILLFFPVFIILFNDIRRLFSWLWFGKKPAPEEVERIIIDIDKEKLLEEVI